MFIRLYKNAAKVLIIIYICNTNAAKYVQTSPRPHGSFYGLISRLDYPVCVSLPLSPPYRHTPYDDFGRYYRPWQSHPVLPATYTKQSCTAKIARRANDLLEIGYVRHNFSFRVAKVQIYFEMSKSICNYMNTVLMQLISQQKCTSLIISEIYFNLISRENSIC